MQLDLSCLVFLSRVSATVQDDVAVFVFDPETPGWVAGFLPAICVDRLDCTIWILSPLEVGRVDLLLARVEMDLFGAIPEGNSIYLNILDCEAE